MSNDARQVFGASGKAKRRLTDADEDATGRSSNPNQAAEDIASHPKRQRVSRACDSCRSKKDKCDGIQPVCSTCAALCRPCTYKANPKKRGLPTGYIRTLELLWGLVFSRIRGSEDVVRALLKAVNIPSHLASMGKEAEGSDTLLASFKNSIVLRDIEQMLTLLEQPEEEQDKRVQGPGDSPPEIDTDLIAPDSLEWQLSDVLGNGGEHNPLPPVLSPAKTPTNISTMKAARHSTKDCSTQTLPSENEMHISILDNPPQRVLDQKEDSPLNLPSNAWSLLDVYFTYTQCWLPILEKHDILRTAFRYSEEAIRVPSAAPGSGDHAALWAALTLASFQEVSISVTRQLGDPPEDRTNPLDLYDIAKNLIPPEDGAHEIGHVQALLILSLVKLGQQDWEAVWILVGQSVRISQLLRLDDPSAGQPKHGGHGRLHERTNHVFLGCFVLETLVAMQTQQSPSLRKEDLTKTGPVNEDGLEEWHPWEDQTGLRPGKLTRESFHRGPLHALSTFNRLVSLVTILNDLCCLRQKPNTSLPQLELLERQLQLWVTSLPKTYRVDVQKNQTKMASPHVFGLEMMYEGIATALGLQLATHEDNQTAEKSRKRRATESSKKSLLLLQTYMETYSLSTTSPTFGMILTFGNQEPDELRTALSVELDFGLKHKLQSFSSHVASVWTGPEKTTAADQVQVNGVVAMPLSHQGIPMDIRSADRGMISDDTAQGSLRIQTAVPNSRNGTRMDLIDENRVGVNTNPFLSNPWLRTPASLEESASLLRTPTPSLATTRTAGESSHQPSQLSEAVSSRTHHPLSATGPPILPDLPTPFQSNSSQCPPTYNEPNLNLASFVDIDGYGPPRRQKIAPDLDALFDELASLDGTEK